MVVINDPPSGLPVPRRTDRTPRNKRQGRVQGPGDVAQIDAQVLRDPGLHATPADFGAGIGNAIEMKRARPSSPPSPPPTAAAPRPSPSSPTWACRRP
ncbi:MAG: hypothetical protein ACE5FR_14120, partial [Rhodospirillales bacterium]